MKTTETIKKFAKLYFQIETFDDDIPISIYYMEKDDYTYGIVSLSMLDKEFYKIFLEEILDEKKINDNALINIFNEIDTSFLNELPIPNEDINNLEEENEYCGWVIKKDNLDEIIYIKHDYM